jgi:hypothetical protein
MNKLLSQSLSYVNAFFAILIIIGSGFSAMFLANENHVLALILGILGGFIAAVLICGALAVFLNIRDELVLVNNFLNDLKNEKK